MNGELSFKPNRLQVNDIDLKYLEITPLKFMTTQDFLKNIDFIDANDSNLKSSESVLGQYLYIFKVKYNETNLTDSKPLYTQEWFIRKRVKDFQDLEKAVNLDPMYLFKTKEIQKETIEQLPQRQMRHLHQYLESLKRSNIKGSPLNAFLRFMELSYVQYGSQKKYKECYLEKKAGGRYGESKCARCGTLWGAWIKRFFVITSEGVMYSRGPDRNDKDIREVLCFDYEFSVYNGYEETGHHRGIILKSTKRKLELYAADFYIYVDFLDRLKEAMSSSPYTKIQRFDSFAPIRKGFCKWYISGEEYFSDLHQALLKAKKSVYITGWWLSPEFYLKRPVGRDDSSQLNRDSRLDIILKNVADRGCLVLIIVYNEPTIALNNDSEHTKQHLESISPNIKVLRHPNQTTIPSYWSHHEKMVIIDQQIGFMGGLDICYGRMDNKEHRLYDNHYEDTISQQEIHEYWPGIDYSNSRVKDFLNVKQHWICAMGDKREDRKMPWQDIAMQVVGEPVTDMTRHFIQFWNFANIDLNQKQRQQLLEPNAQQYNKAQEQQPIRSKLQAAVKRIFRKPAPKEEPNSLYKTLPAGPNPNELQKGYNSQQNKGLKSSFMGMDPQQGHFSAYLQQLEGGMRRHSAIESEVKPDSHLPTYYASEEQKNQNIEIFSYMNEDMDNLKERTVRSQTQVPKPPTQRVSQVVATSTVGTDNRSQSHLKYGGLEKHQQNMTYFQMMKNLQTPVKEDEYYERSTTIKHIDQSKYLENSAFRKDKLIPEIWDAQFLIQSNYGANLEDSHDTVECQLLRSASRWSIGCKDINREMSIQVAYITLIAQAQHFIYIENQFFISSSGGKKIENQIANALITRIRQAAANKEPFKVIVFLPLLPGFEGEIDDNSTIMKVQLHWEYATICRGGTSLLEQLRQDPNISDPSDYIEFFSLRQHAKSPSKGIPNTEIIYIHSKLMIIDDEIALIGSANINDRSLMGVRDSEIAMIIQDQVKVESRLAGKPVQRSKFAQSLRTSLYQAHTGLSFDEIIDPLDKNLISVMRSRAQTNTLAYREVFACYPDDTVRTLAEYQKFKLLSNLDNYESEFAKVKGQIVEFPLLFLEQEDLRIGVFNREILLPDINFT